MAGGLITVTEAASRRLEHLVDRHGEGACGIRLAVKPTGCSGYSYKMDFANEIVPGDEIVEAGATKLVVDAMAVMFVLGTELDFVEDKLGSQFVFRNPNEKARCGCGESFTV